MGDAGRRRQTPHFSDFINIKIRNEGFTNHKWLASKALFTSIRAQIIGGPHRGESLRDYCERQ
jgi:hypothetical protein